MSTLRQDTNFYILLMLCCTFVQIFFMKIPPYLQNSSIIGIVAPGGYMALENIQPCIKKLEEWGYRVQLGKTIGQVQENYFAASDVLRCEDMQAMLDNPAIDAILCARGGYGTSRIIDQLDFSTFCQSPKWLIGFSDITLFHSHVASCLQIASLHAPMAAAFTDENNAVYIDSLQHALSGKHMLYSLPATIDDIQGVAEGALVGGNLALLAHAIGSVSALDFTGKILFLEDVGEYIYTIDRMLYQLKRAGCFQHLAGVILGSFSETKDTVAPFGKNIETLLKEHFEYLNIPVCWRFPVGHTKDNFALKHGVQHRLTINSKQVLLEELR